MAELKVDSCAVFTELIVKRKYCKWVLKVWNPTSDFPSHQCAIWLP